MPDGHDADYVRQVILEHFNMSLGTGLGKIKGKAFRIGHLGDINELMLMGVICGVEMGFGLGWRAAPVRGGGRYAVPCAVKLTPEIRNKPEKDMKKIRLTASVAVLTAAVAAPTFAADVTLKFGHVGKPGSLFEASVNAYAVRQR